MTDIRPLEQTLLDNLPWNHARIKFVARFLVVNPENGTTS